MSVRCKMLVASKSDQFNTYDKSKSTVVRLQPVSATAPDVPIGIWIVDVDPVAQTVTVETRIGDHSTFDVCAVEDFL